MEKQKSFQFATIGVLAFAVLFMSIGYATYSQVLVSGETADTVQKEFYVELDSDSYQEGAGSITPSSKTVSGTGVSFAGHLDKPGDYYLFSIKALNLGGIDGVVDNIWMTTLSNEQDALIDFTVNYDNIETLTESGLDLNYAINAANGFNRKTLVVKVLYNPDENAEIPAEGVDFDYRVDIDCSEG